MIRSLFKKNSPFLVVISSFIESYDYLLFGTFLFILAPLFFPESNESSAILKGFALFGASFAVRPLGCLFFGHWSDRWGRKSALSASLLLMIIPTLVIALLPGYAVLGLAAPIILTMARLTQVFSMGGEMSVAAVFLAESAPNDAKASWAAFFAMAGVIGIMVAMVIGFIAGQPWMPEWGWRIPFFIGALFSFIGLILRLYLLESPAYKDTKSLPKTTWGELADLLKYDWKSLLITFLLPGAAMAPTQWFFVYMPHFLESTWSLPHHVIFALNACVAALWIPAYFIAGRLADRWGIARVILTGAVIFALAVTPVFYWLSTETFNFGRTLFALGGLSIFAAMVPGPICAISPALFPVERRTMGWGVGWTIGAIIAAGGTPWLSQMAVEAYGPLASSAVVGAMCISTILGMLWLRTTPRWHSFVRGLSLRG